MNSESRPILQEITGPHFSNTADYDVVSQMMFPKMENFVNMSVNSWAEAVQMT